MLLRNLRPKISGGSMSTRVISRVLASIRPLHCSSIVKHSFELKPTGWPPEGGKFCTTCYDKAINIPFKSLLKSSSLLKCLKVWGYELNIKLDWAWHSDGIMIAAPSIGALVWNVISWVMWIQLIIWCCSLAWSDTRFFRPIKQEFMRLYWTMYWC